MGNFVTGGCFATDILDGLAMFDTVSDPCSVTTTVDVFPSLSLSRRRVAFSAA
jgi:hypothetical protein